MNQIRVLEEYLCDAGFDYTLRIRVRVRVGVRVRVRVRVEGWG